MSPEQIIVCWKCAGKTPLPIRFRTVCPHCEIDLHCCKNCRYYSPGKPNDCTVPGTEFIRDREAANFCEEFKVKIAQEEQGSIEKARRLLNLEGEENKRDFNSLFDGE